MRRPDEDPEASAICGPSLEREQVAACGRETRKMQKTPRTVMVRGVVRFG
jgi:hypothetical protein